MKLNLLMAIILPVFLLIQKNKPKAEKPNPINPIPLSENPYPEIGSIQVTTGFRRISQPKGSFGEWIRKLPLKKDKTVYTFDGSPKKNQQAQYAVLAISIGNKDLQQCADAVMRLRAEYLYEYEKYDRIIFWDNNNKAYPLLSKSNRQQFDQYLEKVFTMCGTLSLEKQLKPLADLSSLKMGDVLIQGGSPGHAMLVADMAINDAGKLEFILAQSYMPAQDIHIVINPLRKDKSPWYSLNDSMIVTPEWIFPKGHFKTW